jgi:mono/diheme cytochrome c family protein
MRTPPDHSFPRSLAAALWAALVLAISPAPARAADGAASFAIPKEVSAVLAAHCAGCHGDGGKGNIDVTALDRLKLGDRLETLNKIQDQLFYKMMPPPKSEQPGAADARALADWVRAELRAHKASKLDERLPYPDAGNFVEHASLFDGSNTGKASTPARRWLVSPQIFEERVLDVFQLTGRERDNLRRSGFHGVTNPFVLPDHAGVRYYDLTHLDGGHLLVMLTNAEWIASKQLQPARVKAGDPKALPEDPKDKWAPKTTPAAFEAVVGKKAAPTDDAIQAAVRTQFGLVLQRTPTDAEMREYVALTRDAIQAAGNAEGLRQMLKAVLLESEFVYRLEFGAGKPDEHGRVPLAPREAAYAIAYALGDRGPDAQLFQAAERGQFITKADYEREVRRLLADKDYFRGPVDKSLSGMHIHSHVTGHPRLVRFFREFFGYPGATKVFKDIPRSGGYYQNPDRGHLGSPGWLVHEADEFVIHQVDQDRQVFERLLTSDEYFVYHNMDAKTGKALIAEWKQVYDSLKGTEWKTKPEQVMAEHQKMLTAARILDPRTKELWKEKRSFLSYMYWFQDTFGQGRTPFTRGPFTHGYHYDHSPSYSLLPTPSRLRYVGVETANFKEPKDTPAFWDYPVEQPFRVANRKGILTHPAWLVAFSANTASDPIRRGRWIREKLLAGVVPDVPITVDAKVPDDPHRTLRERVSSVTKAAACVKCHSRMNDLGYPLEQFDDFGRFRTLEKLEHPDSLVKAGNGKTTFDVYKTKPIDPTGVLSGTGDPKLDGPVTDSFDLIDRLAKSDRVRQSIIRHAFRFFMGRNEVPSDSKTLIDADTAYVRSGGSFKAVVVSLLTSDSFIYRKQPGN